MSTTERAPGAPEALETNAVPADAPAESVSAASDAAVQVPVFQPRIDVLASDTTVRVRADLPGVHTDSLELSFHRGVLNIDALAAQHRFVRKVRLDWPIDAEANIDAKLVHGVLTVDLVRADAPRPARRIAVS
jgi:HSP20 family molecular chaperone IbpA